MATGPHLACVVIGAGVVGAACARAIGRARPADSLWVVDAGEPASGATAAAAGLGTLLTKRPESLCPAAESLRLHEQWGIDHAACAPQPCDVLLLLESEADIAVADALVDQVRRYDPFVERLSPDQVRLREPSLMGRIAGGLWSPSGLRFRPREMTQAWLADAIGGVMMGPMGLQQSPPPPRARLRTEVISLHPAPDVPAGQGPRWLLRTTAGLITADQVVVAAAERTADLMRPLGWDLPLRARRGQALLTVPVDPPTSDAQSAGTDGVIEVDDALPIGGRSSTGGFRGLRAAVVAGTYPLVKLASAAPPDSPDDEGPLEYAFAAVPQADGRLWLGATRRFSRDVRLRADERIRLLHGAMSRLRGFGPELVDEEVAGLRVWSPDGLPLVGEMPGMPGLFVAAGHEGDGVTMAPLTGALIAAQGFRGRSVKRVDAGDLRPDRFGRSWVPVEPGGETQTD